MATNVPMKITVVEPRGSGGMVHYAYQLCNALSQAECEVDLVTANTYELDAYPHAFKVTKLLHLWTHHSGRPAAPIHNRVKQWWRRMYRSVRRVFRGIRLFFGWIKLSAYLLRTRPDIVQFGSIEFPFEAVFLKFLKSRGLTLTQICHEFEPRERAASLLVGLNNRLLKNVFEVFSAIFFHSPSNVERFRELYPNIPAERFHLISMGNGQIFPAEEDQAHIAASLRQRYTINSTHKVVLFFGNITPSKGVPDLLCAFEKVHANNSQARLVIAGMPLKYIDVNGLFELADRLGINTVTRFDMRYLPMEEVGPLIELATVVVFPYISSTQSASIQAAYAFGKPVVATRVGGLPDIVVDGESGYLVEPGSPGQLSSAILKIIDHAEQAEKMGRAAKNLSETRFAWGPIARSIVTVYENILKEKVQLR